MRFGGQRQTHFSMWITSRLHTVERTPFTLPWLYPLTPPWSFLRPCPLPLPSALVLRCAVRSVGPSIGGSVFSLAVSLVNKSSPTSFLLLHIPYALLALLFIVSFFITYRLPQWVNKAPVRLQPHSPSTAAAANAAAATVASSTHEVSIDVDQHDIDISSNGQLGDSDSEEIQEPRPFSFSSSERVTV